MRFHGFVSNSKANHSESLHISALCARRSLAIRMVCPAHCHLRLMCHSTHMRTPALSARLRAMRVDRRIQSTQGSSGRRWLPAIFLSIVFWVLRKSRFSFSVSSHDSLHHSSVCPTHASKRRSFLDSSPPFNCRRGHSARNFPHAAPTRARISADVLPRKVKIVPKTLNPSVASTIGIRLPPIWRGTTGSPSREHCITHLSRFRFKPCAANASCTSVIMVFRSALLAAKSVVSSANIACVVRKVSLLQMSTPRPLAAQLAFKSL